MSEGVPPHPDGSSSPQQSQAERDASLLHLAGRLARFGGWSIEVPGGELYWSAELFTMLGFDQTAGTPPYELAIGLYPPSDRDHMQAAVERCMTAGTPMDLECTILDSTGRELRVRTIGEAVRDDAGQIVRIQGAFYDVTEIVTAREERIAAQEGLRRTLDYVPDVVAFVDEQWHVTFANRATREFTGMSAEQLASDTIWALFPETTRNALRPVYEAAMVDRVSGTARAYVEQVDAWVEVTVHPVDAGVAVFARDVTADERARREKGELEQRLNATLDQIQDGLIVVDRQWRYTYLNDTAETYLQNTAEQLLGKVMWEENPDAYGAEFGALYRRAMEERVTGTVRAHHPGLGTWFESTAYPTEEGIAVYLRDVSDDEARRQEFAAMSARAQEQADLLEASNEAMIMEDLDNVVTYWNQGAEQIYGWTREEAVGRNIRDLLYDDAAVFEEPAAALLREGRWHGEMVQRTKDGRTVIIECRWQAVQDAEGKPVRLFAVNSDVTAMRRQQELQSRAQRMESLGTLAGGIAHDLNNALTPLLMSVQLMKSQQPTPEDARLLDGMEVSVKRGADMIRQVLSFARGVDGVRDLVDIAGVLDELATMSLQTLPKDITVRRHLDEVAPIVGDRTQILQVLMNLVANARDAMPDGGELTVSVREHTVDQVQDAASTLVPGDYALIAIEDTGTGMSRDVLDKIFEPFFTTKELGSGTGLGLASSMAIVKSHGGLISAYSELGTGTRFVVYLPVANGRSRSSTESPYEQPPASGAGELILVVDDEGGIRQMVSLTLRAHGYQTVEASNGREAIEVFAQHADDVQLVLTDMMMPVMDGAATAAYFFEHHPHIAVVAASGLNADGGVARASHTGVRHFVAKPFTTETLLRTVHEALREHGVNRPASAR
jgi:two-component system, cell cycle sensor histidine kinase and response regulator CckA